MPTWHQARRPVRWAHPYLWTLAEGTRPNEFLSLTVGTREQINALDAEVARLRPHVGRSIVPPCGTR